MIVGCPAGNMYDETNIFAILIALIFTGLLALMCYLLIRDIQGKYVKYLAIGISIIIVALNIIALDVS